MGSAFQKRRPINHSWRSGNACRGQLAPGRLRASRWRRGIRICVCSTGTWPRTGSQSPRTRASRSGGFGGARSSVGFLHFHWPESLYRYGRGPARLRPLLSRVKLALFAARLAAARLLGYRIVWTIHQLYPHESVDRALERRGARFLARASDLLIAHDHWTAAQARVRSSRFAGRKIAVVPHGSYIGAYPEGRPRSEVRSELGLPQDSFVFLCFGELRAYKDVELLLAAFSSCRFRTRGSSWRGTPRARALVPRSAPRPRRTRAS